MTTIPALLRASPLVRYLGVGAVVLGADFLCYTLIVTLNPAWYVPANVAAKLVGAALGFILHGRVTFAWEKRHSRLRQAISYVTVLAANMLLSTGLLYLGIELLGADEVATKAVAECVVVGVAFLANRYVVFAMDR